MMEKIIEFEPGYDKRDPNPSKNYGVASMRIRFILKGKLGAFQFLMDTGWYLPHVAEEFSLKAMNNPKVYHQSGPTGWDIGYHSPKPTYEGQEPFGTEPCEYIGVPCYYDGSSLAADNLLPKFLTIGVDAVWKELEERYTEKFGALE